MSLETAALLACGAVVIVVAARAFLDGVFPLLLRRTRLRPGVRAAPGRRRVAFMASPDEVSEALRDVMRRRTRATR